MEYQILLSSQVVKKDLPKLKKSGLNLEPLKKIFKKLQVNPYINSKAKVGDLTGCRAVNWNNGYRLLFSIDDNKRTVTIVCIESHSEVYKKAKRRKSK